MPPPSVTPHPELIALVNELKGMGVRRIHSVAWRDLDDPEAGGSEVHADNIFRRWAAAGLELHHRTSTATRTREFQRHGYHVTQRGGRYSVFPREILRQFFSLHRYDAVIEIWNGVPWFAALWARAPRVTWMHHIHTDMWGDSLPSILAPFGRLLESQIAPPFYKRTPLITLAGPTRDILIKKKFNPDRVHVVSPGIADDFAVNTRVPKTDAPSLVAVGRLAPVKQFDELIRLMVDIVQEIPHVRLTIVGDGPDRETLSRLITELGMDRHITLAGRVSQEELVRLYQSSWLVVSASHSEGWGMTITEAAACGTPAVALLNDGHRAAIHDTVTGVLSENLARLRGDIVSVMMDQVRRENLGAQAALRAAQFTWDNAAISTLRVLRDEVRRNQR